MTAFKLGRIAACIAVTDIERSTAFYEKVLALEKSFENGDPVGFVILKRDDAELHLTLDRTHKAGENNVAHLLVSDIATVHDRCKRSGVSIVKALRDHDFGLRAFVIADPDGNRIDIGQSI